MPREAAPIRLLHVFATFAVGGPQMRFAAIANRLGPAFSHGVIAMDGRLEARALLDPSLDVSFPSLDTRGGSLTARVGRFARLLRDRPPHRLVTSNWGSIDWAFARAITRTPHLHMEDGFGPEERDRQLPRRVWTRRAALRGSDVLVPSRTLHLLAAEVWRLPAGRLHHVPNGVDLARFVPRPRPASAVPVIGTVAALRAEKRLDRLLEAFAIVRQQRPARLAIAGDGPERASLQARAAELGCGDAVDLLGHRGDSEAVYADFDIFALSSDTEQMPLSVLEAMACGLPVAATDVGDVRWMLADANAPHVVARSAEALAGAMLALLADAGGIGGANRQRAQAVFDEASMVAAHGRLWCSQPQSLFQNAPGTVI